MLFTKCILSDPLLKDGLRISVMSRHTLQDGITADLRIRNFDIHMPILGPSPELIGSYYKRGLPWEEFERRYLEEIRSAYLSFCVEAIARAALESNMTLLCIEPTPEKCHRRLLAEECKRLVPKLAITHR